MPEQYIINVKTKQGINYWLSFLPFNGKLEENLYAVKFEGLLENAHKFKMKSIAQGTLDTVRKRLALGNYIYIQDEKGDAL